MIVEKCKKGLLELYQYWTGLKYVNYILFSLILTLVLTIPFVILFEVIGIRDEEIDGPQLDKLGLGVTFTSAIVIAPITETLIGQVIPIKIVQRYIKLNTNKIAVIVSTFLFALGHISYSFWYFLLTIPMAFVLSVTYITFQKREQSSFWTTAFIHALRNSLALISFL